MIIMGLGLDGEGGCDWKGGRMPIFAKGNEQGSRIEREDINVTTKSKGFKAC